MASLLIPKGIVSVPAVTQQVQAAQDAPDRKEYRMLSLKGMSKKKAEEGSEE